MSSFSFLTASNLAKIKYLLHQALYSVDTRKDKNIVPSIKELTV